LKIDQLVFSFFKISVFLFKKMAEVCVESLVSKSTSCRDEVFREKMNSTQAQFGVSDFPQLTANVIKPYCFNWHSISSQMTNELCGKFCFKIGYKYLATTL
jgi:hypothetical protein